MFVNNINPILLQLGPFSIRYYGIIYALGFVLAYMFLQYSRKKGRIKLTERQLDNYIIWLIVGVVAGARIVEVFIYNPQLYPNKLVDLFYIWQGGLAFHGGLLGAAVVTYIFSRKYKFNFYDIADLLALPGAIALMLGRIANFTNSELYGSITNPSATPWCVVFARVDNYCRHPAQLYEAVQMLVVGGILYIYDRYHARRQYSKYRKGTIFWLFILLYGIGRFFITFLRVDEPTYLGLNPGQWLSALMVVVAAIFLWEIYKTKAN